jgi:hypothetical protein
MSSPDFCPVPLPQLDEWSRPPRNSVREHKCAHWAKKDEQRLVHYLVGNPETDEDVIFLYWGAGAAVVQNVEDPFASVPGDADIERHFRELAKRWREETKTLSSTTDRAMHSAYQDIIGMGERVVPLILREMQEHGGHWFWALRHITRQNPVRPEDAGKIQRMTEAWLRWGRENHYL